MNLFFVLTVELKFFVLFSFLYLRIAFEVQEEHIVIELMENILNLYIDQTYEHEFFAAETFPRLQSFHNGMSTVVDDDPLTDK